MRDIGSRIREARKRCGLSQRALAQYLCKCTSAISGYENNVQTPPVDVLVRIASRLNVSMDYLTGFELEETYSVKGFTEQQRQIVDALFAEFTHPSTGSELSPRQIEILQKLILQFSK